MRVTEMMESEIRGGRERRTRREREIGNKTEIETETVIATETDREGTSQKGGMERQ